MNRRKFWKERFEQAFHAGDKAAMVEAENMLEAYAAYDAMMMEERMKQELERRRTE